MNALVVLLGMLLAAPPSALAASPGASPASAPGAIDVIVESSQHWVGTNDVLLTAYDADGRRLAEDGVPLVVELTGPGGQVVRAQAAVERFATYGRHLYRARLPLGEIGEWQVRVNAEIDASPTEGRAVLQVLPDDGTPPLGSLVPGGATPTMRDAHSLMHHISSDPEPLTAFYTWSLDEALQQHQPTVFVLDSYAFRPNAACGGALGILHEVFIDYPGLTMVHAEPWHMLPDSDGMLQLDPPGGPAVLTDYALAWGVREPPWVFVIDREGRLQAKFAGVVGSDELRAALASITAWRPAA